MMVMVFSLCLMVETWLGTELLSVQSGMRLLLITDVLFCLCLQPFTAQSPDSQ